MAKRRTFDWGKITDTIKNSEKKGSFSEDLTIFKPKLKDDGSYNAIIRFLPPALNESLPFVKIYNHGFKNGQQWFINNCPTTLGLDCPVCKENGRIWDEQEHIARPRSRKLSFYANILVVTDPQCKENEGKVFKYRYGKKIHEKIMEKLNPEAPEIDPVVPVFDYENGANFKLKIKKVKSNINGKMVEYPNYDASSFAEPSSIGLSDKELDALDAKIYELQPIIAKSEFKSYSQLATDFTRVTGIKISTSPSDDNDEPVAQAQPSAKTEAPAKEEEKEAPAVQTEGEEDFFKNLQQ